MNLKLGSITMDFDEAAKIIHKNPKFSHIPNDIVDEILELVKSKYKYHTSNYVKGNILLGYFNHTLKCKVIKKFQLSNKEKQLLFCSVHFLDMFLENAILKHKNVLKLYDVLTRIGTRHHLDIEKQMSYAYKQFEKIVGTEDIYCNQLVLATMTAIYFAKSAKIDKKLSKKIIDLANSVYDDVERSLEKEEDSMESFNNSTLIAIRFCEKNEKEIIEKITQKGSIC